jgi:hypothetical protein
MKFPESARNAAIEKAVLKQEVRTFMLAFLVPSNSTYTWIEQTKLDDCADAFIAVATNTSMTGQQIVVGRSHPSHQLLPTLFFKVRKIISPLTNVETLVLPYNRSYTGQL